MRIETINVYTSSYPFVEPLSASKLHPELAGFEALIVELIAEDGTRGWGEFAPLGSFYSEAFAAGARAGVVEAAEYLVGLDAQAVRQNSREVGLRFRGHPYVKSALDMANCDLAARLAGCSLATWFGGVYGDYVDVYGVVIGSGVDQMASAAAGMTDAGARRLQVKVGGVDARAAADRLRSVLDACPPGTTIYCDANGRWTQFEALRFLQLTRGLDYILEQPCPTVRECAALRLSAEQPIVLDESIMGVRDVLETAQTSAADGVTIKISRVGGPSQAAHLRDLANDLGLMVSIEDTGGAAIDTSVMAHLSMSTPEEMRMHTSAWNHWLAPDALVSMPHVDRYRLYAPSGDGCGVDGGAVVTGLPVLTTTAGKPGKR
ncbi:mandelate racemase/muconate lactonizing enzyme family protein [Paenarthrobacter sp. NPDC057981]|uniref:mandelate racemase/muconate lactonizing enzyme family protein n=1 Tax=Paenarthrobacter sp. NPDC057981 TaxID=3346297 RepID=UPI0036DF6D00